MTTPLKLLHIDSSILGDRSASRAVTREIVSRWRAAFPELEVTHVDLASDAVPHLSGGSLAREDGSEAERDAHRLAEFLAADVIVIGAPMYNFTVPTQLKAWIDRVLVAGKTFRYTASGAEGLAGGKRVIVAVSRGGVYPPSSAGEYAESYLRHVFAFVGINEVTFVRAEGLAISPESRQKGLAAALAAIPAPEARAA
ncbi:MAG TPA: NAD(P)H-dependent oxidoreductase [Steroidobacteraceae bacterium]|nr:NAD(P)H-dependent oxidoreductase [Steroidobacteraceae bacterium]